MSYFNSHKFKGDIAANNRAMEIIRADKETPESVKAEQLFDTVYAHWAQAEALPTIKHFHLFGPEIFDDGHVLTVTLAALDTVGQSKLISTQYRFNDVDLNELIRAEGGFTHALALLYLYQVIPLLGMCEVSETVTMSSLLGQDAWLPPAPPSGCESDPAIMLTNVIRKLGKDPQVLQTIAALAWQDRINLFRIMDSVGIPYAEQANPYHVELADGYTNNVKAYVELGKANVGRVSVDMKWDSNSLLTGTLLNCTASKFVLSSAADQRGSDATALSVELGYQDILNEVAPLTPVPYYGTATIEALAQILNGWNDADTLYVGDQYEKNIVGPVFRKRQMDGHADHAVLLELSDDQEFKLYGQVGYCHGSDMGRTVYGHNLLNNMLVNKAQVSKRVATVLSNYPQILVDYLLGVFDKKSNDLVKKSAVEDDGTEFASVELHAEHVVKTAYARIRRDLAYVEVAKSLEATIYYKALTQIGDVGLIVLYLEPGDSLPVWFSLIEDQLLGQMTDRVMSDDIRQVQLMDQYIGEFQARVAANLKAWRSSYEMFAQ